MRAMPPMGRSVISWTRIPDAAGDEAMPKFMEQDTGKEAGDEQQAEKHATEARARLDPPDVREPEYDERECGVDANVDPRDAREPECAHAALFQCPSVPTRMTRAAGLPRRER